MTATFLYFLIAIICLILGFVIGKLLTKNTLEKLTSELEIRNKLLLEEKEINKLNISPKKIVSVAEVLTKEDKEYLQNVFNCKISEVYQCTEGFLANSCSEGYLHFNEDFLIIEKKYIDNKKTKFESKQSYIMSR